MARKVQQRKVKKAIYVFWEGESEEAYSKSLKRMFAGQAVIKPPREKGTLILHELFIAVIELSKMIFLNMTSYGSSLIRRSARRINGNGI